MISKEEFKKLYGFNTGDIKWVPKGGELLECIGQRVIRVHFDKDEEGNFKSTEDQALIKSIWGYDDKKMTYQITYTLPDSEEPIKEYTEEIIPEGFGTGIIAQEEGKEMNRFIPGHIHLRVVKEDLFYSYLAKLFKDRSTLSKDELYEIDRYREQSRFLKYSKNIRLVGEVDGEICSFRIGGLKIRKNDKDTSRLTIYNAEDEKKSLSIVLKEEDTEYNIPELGVFKIIDIQSKDEEPEVSN